MTHKMCPDCGETKPLDGFHRHKTGAGGRNTYCKPCVVARAKASRERRAEEVTAYNRAYYLERRDAWLERDRERYAAMSPADRAALSRRVQSRVVGLTGAALTRHRAMRVDREGRRRARQRRATAEKVDRDVLFDCYGGICGICGLQMNRDDFHVDHIVPLVHGGEHSYANTQPTHPKCNLSKGAHMASKEMM